MSKRDKFLAELIRIADDNSHGYDQTNRWGPNYDCSSLVYHAAHVAGYDIKEGSGYTGTLLADFLAAGWTAVEYDGNVNDMTAGDIILRVGHHVEVALSPTEWIGAHINEQGGVTGGKSGDQTGNEIGRCKPYHYGTYPNDWDYVLIPPKESSGTSTPAPSNIKTELQEARSLYKQAEELQKQADELRQQADTKVQKVLRKL